MRTHGILKNVATEEVADIQVAKGTVLPRSHADYFDRRVVHFYRPDYSVEPDTASDQSPKP